MLAAIERRTASFGVALATVACLCGCVGRFADDLAADAVYSATIIGSGGEDEEMARQAAPVGLKLLELLHEGSPDRVGILVALCAAYAQYAFGFLQIEAEQIEDRDPARARALQARAHRLYVRAREYGLDALDLRHPGFRRHVLTDTARTIEATIVHDAPLLYYAATAWSAAVPPGAGDPSSKDQTIPVAMVRRAIELDEEFGEGALHEYLAVAEAIRGDAASLERARKHMDRALELSEGTSISIYVAWAKIACAYRRDTEEFNEYLERALSFDPYSTPRHRLGNLLSQRRARWLRQRVRDCSRYRQRETNVVRLSMAPPTSFEPGARPAVVRGAPSNDGRSVPLLARVVDQSALPPSPALPASSSNPPSIGTGSEGVYGGGLKSPVRTPE